MREELGWRGSLGRAMLVMLRRPASHRVGVHDDGIFTASVAHRERRSLEEESNWESLLSHFDSFCYVHFTARVN